MMAHFVERRTRIQENQRSITTGALFQDLEYFCHKGTRTAFSPMELPEKEI